jgi:hypothetical protein
MKSPNISILEATDVSLSNATSNKFNLEEVSSVASLIHTSCQQLKSDMNFIEVWKQVPTILMLFRKLSIESYLHCI